jgi:ParB family transcriptional regulator, chromosome partitioning protein
MIPRRRSGLGALIPGGELPTASGPELVPITAIAVNPYQPRRMFAPEALAELAESIRQHGVLQPLAVRPREGGYELIAGERRLQAARQAGLSAVPVVVRPCGDEEMLALALVENLQREDLNAMESARSYGRLIEEFGLSQADVAARVGKSRSTVANTVRLLGLPAPMQRAVEDGTLSEGHARALLAVTDAARQETLFAEAVGQGLSVRELEARVQPAPRKTTRRRAKAQAGDGDLAHLQAELQRALSTRVRFAAGSSGESGTLEIAYYTQDDLQRLYDLLMGG